MNELLVATQNKGKLREIRALLKDMDFKVTSLADYPDCPEIIEDGKTFAQNAIKKAATISMYTKKLVLGEDSGIQIEALNNRPGVYSARYSGPNATDAKNNAKMLRELKGVKGDKRRARYQCFAALCDKNGVIDVVSGQCTGYITEHARGTNGFGYDPYFLIKRYGKTFGELDPAIKARMSHRARALKKIKAILANY